MGSTPATAPRASTWLLSLPAKNSHSHSHRACGEVRNHSSHAFFGGARVAAAAVGALFGVFHTKRALGSRMRWPPMLRLLTSCASPAPAYTPRGRSSLSDHTRSHNSSSPPLAGGAAAPDDGDCIVLEGGACVWRSVSDARAHSSVARLQARLAVPARPGRASARAPRHWRLTRLCSWTTALRSAAARVAHPGATAETSQPEANCASTRRPTGRWRSGAHRAAR